MNVEKIANERVEKSIRTLTGIELKNGLWEYDHGYGIGYIDEAHKRALRENNQRDMEAQGYDMWE